MDRPNSRRADHAIDPLFIERWSPRAFTGEAVPESELMRMFEAARWAAVLVELAALALRLRPARHG